ncbi:hypothetical protein NXY56_002033 [Leishmania guyanensis]
MSLRRICTDSGGSADAVPYHSTPSAASTSAFISSGSRTHHSVEDTSDDQLSHRAPAPARIPAYSSGARKLSRSPATPLVALNSTTSLTTMRQADTQTRSLEHTYDAPWTGYTREAPQLRAREPALATAALSTGTSEQHCLSAS